MKIFLTIETNEPRDDEMLEPRRVTKKHELETINSALAMMWKLKKPRMATLTFLPEDAEERIKTGFSAVRGHAGELFSKRNQRRGISITFLTTIDEARELPALHKNSYPFWRQLPTRFNEVMKDLLKKLNPVNANGETGNAYDDLFIDAVIEKPKKAKKKAKKKAFKKKAYKKKDTTELVEDDEEQLFGVEDNDELPGVDAPAPIPAEEDEEIFDLFETEDSWEDEDN